MDLVTWILHFCHWQFVWLLGSWDIKAICCDSSWKLGACGKLFLLQFSESPTDLNIQVNTLTAKFILSEHTSKKDYMSSLIIICGILLTVFGSERNQIDWSIEVLVNQYKKTNVKVMLCILASLIGACFIIMRMDYVKRRNEARSKNEAIERPSTVIGFFMCCAPVPLTVFACHFAEDWSCLLHRCIFCGRFHSFVRQSFLWSNHSFNYWKQSVHRPVCCRDYSCLLYFTSVTIVLDQQEPYR